MKIETKNLCIGYDRAIVSNINISVNDSETVVLIGPNGAGKTTLLKTVSGIIRPISGNVIINNKDLSEFSLSELAKSVAVVLTEKTYADYTCEEMVAMGRYPYTNSLGRISSTDKEIVDESMELTSITEIKDKSFLKLSDGQRQRVLLARAICQRPEILILDEPTSFLDVKYKMEFLSTLKMLSLKMGFSVLMSLHELDMVKQIADKVICMKNDMIDRTGTVDEIFKDGYIKELFEITSGDFDERTGTGIICHIN